MEKTLFASGSFSTEDNKQHKFIVAAVIDEYVISFGLSICHPNDESKWDEKRGRAIAKGKAHSERLAIEMIGVSHPMLMPKKFMGDEYVNECLRRICQVIEQTPGRYCTAYENVKSIPSGSYSFSNPTDYKFTVGTEAQK